MRYFAIFVVLIATATAGLVKRDAPAAPAAPDLSLTKLADEATAQLKKIFENSETAINGVTETFKKQLESVTPEMKVHLEKAQADIKKAYEDFKGNKSVGELSKHLDTIMAEAKNNDYLQKLSDTVAQMQTEAQALFKSKVAGN